MVKRTEIKIKKTTIKSEEFEISVSKISVVEVVIQNN